MCGLVGYFGSRKVDLAPAAKAILHRGPDMQNVSSGQGWTIAFNRLSILDLSENGMQPFTFDGITVFMNGEIYNYRELAAEHAAEYACRSGSDVEIVPFLFRKYGLQFLQKLNGMFAMAIADEKNGEHYLVRDRYGKKPLFYKQDGDGVYFASELKALKRLLALKPDRTNLALNMSCWFLVQPLTPYEDVFGINPGCYLKYDGSKPVESRWYSPQIEVREQSFAEINQRFVTLYRQSILLRLRSDVPVGICLSGGLDSSSMAFLAHDISPENFIAFTADIPGKENWEGSTDTENPARLCRDLNIRQIHTAVDFDFWNRNIVGIVQNYDEIFLNSGTLVFYALAEAARKNGVKVLLSGVGGDEILGGYPWQAHMRRLPEPYLRYVMGRPSCKPAGKIHKALASLGDGRVSARAARAFRLIAQFQVWHAQSLSNFFTPYMLDMDDEVSGRIESLSGKYFDFAASTIDDDTYNQIHFANIFTLIGNQNYQLDMASMRHSVENRGPLLDFNLFEYMMTVPDHIKNQHGPKSLMRDMLSAFLPDYITRARKSGPTMPVDEWFGEAAFRGKVMAFLGRNRDAVAEYLSADLAGRLADDSLYQSRAGALRLFAMVSFIIWVKCNVEQCIPDYTMSFAELMESGL